MAATCAFVWDRLLPVYEPVIGGWFVEWSSFFLAAAIGYSLWRDVVEGYGDSLVFQEERKLVIRQLSMQTEYSRQIAETAAENRRLIHDIKHHLRTIDRMAAEHGQSDIRLFLSQVEEQVAAVSSYSHVAFCQNPAVNALIEYYYGMMQTQGTIPGAARSSRSNTTDRCGAVYGAWQSAGQFSRSVRPAKTWCAPYSGRGRNQRQHVFSEGGKHLRRSDNAREQPVPFPKRDPPLSWDRAFLRPENY